MDPVDLSEVWPVETERLRLRPFAAAGVGADADARALLVYRARPEVARYIPHDPMDAAEIARRLATDPWRRQRLARDGDGFVIGFALREDDRVIGDLYLGLSSAEHRGGEVGWVLNPEFGGRGYATEAGQALLDVAFEACGLRRLIARVDARNAASLALARRLGMRQEAHLVANEWFKGEWTDEIDFALLRDEWLVRRTDSDTR